MSKPAVYKLEMNSFNPDGIEVRLYEFGVAKRPRIIHIYKRSLLWIINSLRGKTPEEYLLGAKEGKLKDSDDYFIFLTVFGIDDRNGQGAVQLSVVNKIHPIPDTREPDGKRYAGTISIDTDARDPMDPEGTLYQFLERLEPFVPAQDRDKIIPAWEPQKR